MTAVKRDIVICNALGLHARPAMQFVDLANRFESQITVRCGGDDPVEADGKSVMAMITLGAVCGTPLQIEVDGPDAERAADELTKLVADKFGEDE